MAQQLRTLAFLEDMGSIPCTYTVTHSSNLEALSQYSLTHSLGIRPTVVHSHTCSIKQCNQHMVIS